MIMPEFGRQRQRHLKAQSPQQAGDGARQSPLRNGDAVRDEDADQQNGEIGKADLGKIHHRKREGANELSDAPAPGNPATKTADEGKLPPHVQRQDVYRRCDLSCDIGNDNDQQAAGRDQADDLADCPIAVPNACTLTIRP